MGYEKLTQKLTFYKAFFYPQWKFLIHTILQCLSVKTTAWNEFSSTMAYAIICLATNQKFNFSMYIFDSMVKNVNSMIFGNKKKEGKGFSGRVTSLFQTMMVQAHKEIEHIADEVANEEHVPTQSNDPPLSRVNTIRSGEDRLNNKTAQAKEIASLKKRVKKLEWKRKLKPLRMKRLFKIGRSAQVVSSEDKGLGAQDDASKQGRKIADFDADAEVTLVDEAQGRNDDYLMFNIGVLDEQEFEVKKTLIEIKAAKPKVRGVMIQEPSETTNTTTTPAASKPSQDKGKAKMTESKKPLKQKDQIMYDQEVALNLQAQLQAELEEEERLIRSNEEEDNIALIES
ncbi:hypothetical protein Tco_0651249 [Tanacetum coccineum]